MIRTSLLYWFPLIKDLGIPVPETRTMFVNRDYMLRVLDKVTGWPEGFEEAAKEAASTIGYPLFLRTDLASGKHDWARTCFVLSEDVLMSHIFAVLEFNEIADIVGLPYEALVFRQYITLESSFRAFKGLPIAMERRYFIKDGKVLCHHPYWIEEAVAQGRPQVWQWQLRLQELNTETEEEVELLTSYSSKVAEVLEGYWSIDYAKSFTLSSSKASDGRWFLIDMAEGESSWHPDCEYAKSNRRVD